MSNRSRAFQRLLAMLIKPFDDRFVTVCRLVKLPPQLLLALPYTLAKDFGTRDPVENGARLMGDNLGKHRLPRSRPCGE